MVAEEYFDEVDRALSPFEVRWDGVPSERLTDARRLVSLAVSAVRDGDFLVAADSIRGFVELRIEDRSLRFLAAAKEELGELESVLNDIEGEPTSDAVAVQGALFVKSWMCWALGRSEEEELEFLSRALERLSDVRRPVSVEVRIRQALGWDRVGRSDDAIAALERLAAELAALPNAAERSEQLLAAWFEKCTLEVLAGLMPEAQRSAGTAVEIYRAMREPTAAAKARFAASQWTRCVAIARPFELSIGSPGEEAFATLVDLIEWLWLQPELGMRRLLVRRLMNKMVWLGADASAVSGLEEVVAVLEESDDRGITRYVANVVVEEMPQLARQTAEETDQLAHAVAETLERGIDAWFEDGRAVGRDLPDAVRRLSKALSVLTRRLGADPDPRAVPLRALLLIHEANVLGRLGSVDEQAACFEELVTLGDTAFAACDELIDTGAWRTPAREVPVEVVTMPLVKAGLFVRHDRLHQAIETLDGVIAEFATNTEPPIAGAIQTARVMRDAISEQMQP